MRKKKDNFRVLVQNNSLIDFASNDYLGLSKLFHGSTGSRLITGNSALAEETEEKIARFHGADAALLFSTGYMANMGLLSALGKKGDLFLYDSAVHASTRDGMRLSFAKSYSFRHNDVSHLEKQLQKYSSCYVCIESVYSTDGTLAPLKEITDLCQKYGARLIIDEAHAVGIFGSKGEGLADRKKVFASIVTFGKALGGFGAAVLGSAALKEYLVNFARTAIFTTALPYPILSAIQQAYDLLPTLHKERAHIQQLMTYMETSSPIKTIPVRNNKHGKLLAQLLKSKGFHVPVLLHPTVPEGKEVLRISLHAFNSLEDVAKLKKALGK